MKKHFIKKKKKKSYEKRRSKKHNRRSEKGQMIKPTTHVNFDKIQSSVIDI